jgi:hypothetical protein
MTTISTSILRMLKVLRDKNMRYLLMGGQACVLYGGVQFSHDTGITFLADDSSLLHLQTALQELKATVITVPPLDKKYLDQGLAVHFRCYPFGEVDGIRLDIMTKMRNAPPFAELWERRTTFVLENDQEIDVVAIQDLVQIKKTRRDKDWPMIRCLLESHYACYRQESSREQVDFWLRESRTPEILIEIAAAHPDRTRELVIERPLLQHAIAADQKIMRAGLMDEEMRERELDDQYWQPLLKEFHRLRRQAREKKP